jgi:PAS domain S-box-containing protein
VPYRSVTHDGITLLCFPPHDEVFARLTARSVASVEAPDPDALQSTLRETFPEATVRRREALASLGGGEAWYVYRDGRYSPFAEAGAWWEAADVPRIEIDSDGRYVDANPSALALLGMDLDQLRALRSGDLTDPATRPNLPWVLQLLQDVGELHSTSVLVRPDGERVAVEYRLLLDAAGAGRHVSYLRPVPTEAAEPITAVVDTAAVID